jgi:hypothetical protein
MNPQTNRNSQKVVAVPFETFLKWLTHIWEPGQHMAIIAPTGEGKTTLAIPILKTRKWVMALDPKGEDDTLTKSGFIRVTSLPLSRELRNKIAKGESVRIIVGGESRTDEDDERMKILMRKAISMAREQGGWTIYIDEFQLMADRRMYNLDKPTERLLITARKDGTSVVTSYQAPAWVPKASTRQARIALMGPTRDRQMIKNVAEAMGRDWKEVATITDELPKWYWLAIPRDVRAPIVIAHPPKL